MTRKISAGAGELRAKQTEPTPWPPRIEVGDRVHWGVSSPDTGIVIGITKNRRWARVTWDHNGTRRTPMDQLFSVTRSLTEWSVYKAGKKPCVKCGYDTGTDGLCRICRPLP